VAVAVVLIVLLATVVPDAGACSCPRLAPACEAYWTADAIFRGRVEAVERAPASSSDLLRTRTVRFTVLESLKGVTTSTLQVMTAGSRSTCGYSFVKGREYLVYAWLADGALRTGICSRTRALDRAHADLEYARSTAAGGAPLGRITGRVLIRTRNLATRRHLAHAMYGVSVTIEGAEVTVKAKTDRAGHFSVVGLQPGPYTLKVDLPGAYRVAIDRTPVELGDIRACAAVGVSVYPDGRVAGRITDSSGKPIRGLTVDLTVPRSGPDAVASRGSPDRLQTVTADDGTYELTGVPPGRFVVGINTREDAGASRYARVFYPGVLRSADAALVEVPAAGRVELEDFRVPATVRFVEIAGVVFDTDRVPVEGARVYLRGPEERDFILTAPVVTDLSGRFTIAGVMGQEYLVFAERPRPGDSRWLDSTGLLPVAATPPPTRLTLTLRSQH